MRLPKNQPSGWFLGILSKARAFDLLTIKRRSDICDLNTFAQDESVRTSLERSFSGYCLRLLNYKTQARQHE